MRKSVDRLKKAHRLLLEDVSGFDSDRLEDTAPGAFHFFYAMLHGIVQRDPYHAGQIAIIRK